MGCDYTNFRQDTPDEFFDLINVLHTVVDEKNLPVTLNLVKNGLFDRLFVENMQFGIYGMTVRWSGV